MDTCRRAKQLSRQRAALRISADSGSISLSVAAHPGNRIPVASSECSPQFILQREGMLTSVHDSRRALAAQAPKLSRAGARDDDIGLLRLAVLEYSRALEHEAARLPGNVPDDPLEADERGRAVAAVHHQVFDMPLARDIAGERLWAGGARQLW